MLTTYFVGKKVYKEYKRREEHKHYASPNNYGPYPDTDPNAPRRLPPVWGTGEAPAVQQADGTTHVTEETVILTIEESKPTPPPAQLTQPRPVPPPRSVRPQPPVPVETTITKTTTTTTTQTTALVPVLRPSVPASRPKPPPKPAALSSRPVPPPKPAKLTENPTPLNPQHKPIPHLPARPQLYIEAPEYQLPSRPASARPTLPPRVARPASPEVNESTLKRSNTVAAPGRTLKSSVDPRTLGLSGLNAGRHRPYTRSPSGKGVGG